MESVNKTESGRKIKITFYFLITLAVLFMVTTLQEYMDNDFYHIVVAGRWIAQNKQIMYENPYFILDGYKTIVQQYPYAVALWLIYDNLGYLGAYFFVCIQALFYGFIIYKYLTYNKVQKEIAQLLTLLFITFMPYKNVRPELITMAILLLEMLLLEKFIESKGKNWIHCIVMFPLLMLIETNIHCSYDVFHFIVTLPYLAELTLPSIKRKMEEKKKKKEQLKEAINQAKQKNNTKKPKKVANPAKMREAMQNELQDEISKIRMKLGMLVSCVLMFVASGISPYGFKSLTMLFDSANISIVDVAEHQPMSLGSGTSIYFVVGIILFERAFVKKKIRVSSAFFTLGFGLLSLIAIKNIILFMLAIITLTADLFRSEEIALLKKEVVFRVKNFASVGFILALVISSALFSEHNEKRQDTEMMPIGAIAYMKENDDRYGDLKIMTSYNNGSLFVFNDAGKVYIDPNTTPYVKKFNGQYDVITEYAYLLNYADTEFIENFLNKYQFDYLCLQPKMSLLHNYLEDSDDYECVYVGEASKDAEFDQYKEELGETVPIYTLYKRSTPYEN